jgi:hypothetical protein
MGARQSLLSAGLVAAVLFPSSAFASGVAISAGSGERVDVVHNTIASFSAEGSTVVEQFLWHGDGASTTLWVLPLPPGAEVAYSSDALVTMFDLSLDVVVRQPPNSCFISSGFNGCDGVSVGGAGGSPGTEFLVADPVVAPISSNSLASFADLDAWLAGFGVTPPTDMYETFQAAEAAGYGFLVVELPPSNDLSTSPAVRITSSEASEAVPMLSLRPNAEVKLTLIGDRRFALAGQAVTVIEEKDLEWSWTTMQSSYDLLAEEAIAAGWLAEAGEPLSPYAFDKLIELATIAPEGSGYDLAELGPVAAATADAEALRVGLNAGSTWVTRLTTRVPAAGFPVELELLPVSSLGVVDRDLMPATETGAIPDCDDQSNGCGHDFIEEEMGHKDEDFGSCAAGASAAGGSGWLLLAAAALGLAGRKRRLPKG